MKYIRTKDGIYEFGKIGLVGKEMEKTFFERPSNSIFESEIINQADTIEELFDEFVYCYLDQNQNIVKREMRQYFISQKELESHNIYIAINGYKCKPTLVYGAIWTNKGLIYVAKMNDKGELELL